MTGAQRLEFIAAGLVLATFCMKRLVPLRATAITSNLAFIIYDHIAGIEAIFALRLILAPINIARLIEAPGASLPSPSAAIGRVDPLLEVARSWTGRVPATQVFRGWGCGTQVAEARNQSAQSRFRI